ncbi:MAG TPA: hypothetical protein ENN56_03875 [Firmicutes bacterium]|nr:hypothetical protein [Bacillota bacterium]
MSLPGITEEQIAELLTYATGSSSSQPSLLVGGASDRWYARISGELPKRFGCRTLLVTGVPTTLWSILESFLRNQSFLERLQCPVPRVYGRWPQYGIALIEDFGDIRLVDAISREPKRRNELDENAIDLLVRLHSLPPDPHLSYPARELAFDVEKYQYEFGFHVDTWLIGHHLGVSPTATERRALDGTYRWISETLAAEPFVFTHRDYQSTNLMLRDDGTLGLIDFQDARQGLRQYDLASFIWDSYVSKSDERRYRITQYYRTAAGVTDDPDRFDALLRIAAIQRKLHDAGAFVYTAAHRGKTEYLVWVSDAIGIATDLMIEFHQCHDTGAMLAEWMERKRQAMRE